MASSFAFDPNRCTGCAACRLACTIENDLLPGHSWRRIETFNAHRDPELPLYHLSLACNHCDEPACMYACPALAYSRDEATGAVLLDTDKCIGCRYCSWACPFDAPTFDIDRGVMTKCTFCHDRLGNGLEPACVALCPTGALRFGDLEPTEVVQGVDAFPQTDLGPRLRIEAVRDDRSIPAMTQGPTAPPLVASSQASRSGISLGSEWSLMIFTLLSASMVALAATVTTTEVRVDPLLFAVAAIVTMGLATAHLGRKARAWRAMLNLRRSWLSREIVLLSSFFGTATIWLALAPDDGRAGQVVTLIGFLGLLCADQVYGVLRRAGPGYRHSASVLLTGFFLTGVFAGQLGLASLFGLVKLLLYVGRKRRAHATGRPVRLPLTFGRVTLGFVLPFSLWMAGPSAIHGVIIASVMVGEAIDRAEYYLELERDTPRRRMAEVLLERGALAPGSS